MRKQVNKNKECENNYRRKNEKKEEKQVQKKKNIRK